MIIVIIILIIFRLNLYFSFHFYSIPPTKQSVEVHKVNVSSLVPSSIQSQKAGSSSDFNRVLFWLTCQLLHSTGDAQEQNSASYLTFSQYHCEFSDFFDLTVTFSKINCRSIPLKKI